MFGSTRITVKAEEDTKPLSDQERNRKPISQFYLWFGANLTIADFALGFLPVELFHLNLWYSFLSMLIGTIAGGILLASMSAMGPKTGLPQMMIGRHAFGKNGGMVMSLLQWVNTAGWLTVNTIVAATALSILIYTTSGFLFAIPVILVAIMVLALVYFGQNVIHGFERFISFFLGILFLYVTISTLTTHYNSFYQGGFSWPSFGTTIALSFSYIMSWGPYASDYSRYVKSESKKTFGFTFAGSVLSTIWVETVGALVAFAVSAPDAPSAMAPLLGKYADIGLITLILGGLAANSLNLFSNSVSLRSSGIPLPGGKTIVITLSRRTILILSTILSILLGIIVIKYSNFYSYYEDFLFVLDYWITPWLGIMIADFLLSKGNVVGISEGSNSRTFFAYLAPIIISVPFMSPIPQFEGPIAVFFGGVDISYFVSFSLSLLFFYMLRRNDFVRQS